MRYIISRVVLNGREVYSVHSSNHRAGYRASFGGKVYMAHASLPSTTPRTSALYSCSYRATGYLYLMLVKDGQPLIDEVSA